MEEEKGTFFVGMCLEQENGNHELFPLTFHSKNYQDVCTLVRCVTPGDPRKRIMYADAEFLFGGYNDQ